MAYAQMARRSMLFEVSLKGIDTKLLQSLREAAVSLLLEDTWEKR